MREEIIKELEEDLRKRRVMKEALWRAVVRGPRGPAPADGGPGDDDGGPPAKPKEHVRLVHLPTNVGVRRRVLSERDAAGGGAAGGDGAEGKETRRREEELMQHLGRREQIKLQHLGYFWSQIRWYARGHALARERTHSRTHSLANSLARSGCWTWPAPSRSWSA